LTGDERIPLGANVTGAPATPGFSPQAEWRPDPDHSFNAAALQIGDGAMDGFIPAFRRRLSESPEIVKHGLLDDERRIVSGQPAIRVPVFAYLAEQFCVLDRWFASFPGPTFVNRMCEMTGLTTERTNSALAPDLGYLDARTLFELLDRGNVPWQVYEGDISFLRTFDRFRTEFDKVRPLNEFLDGGTGRLTAVTFVDPNVTGLPSEGHAADDHPPTDVQWGQAFLGEVIKRVMKSESWPTTMLIITYDEHGGFYDHVAPPGTARFHELNPDVDRDLPRVHPDEGKYGVRVPAFVVSPFVSQRAVGHRIYDHATIARTILQRFAPAQIGHMPERVRRSRHLGEVLQAEARTGIAPPPGAETPNPLRIRMDRSTPGVHLAAVRPDPEDAREDLTRLGIPRSP
jgi:phospholipase C